jgi:AcrR family transcriptional regulator
MVHHDTIQALPGSSAREELLQRAIAHVAENGVGDRSLRGLAAALGTSHRMLIHHFGSKDGLWVAIVQAVEQRQRELLGEYFPDPGQPPGDSLRAWWRHLSDPSLWPNERLFFELYGRALQGEEPAREMLEGTVEDWLDAAVAAGAGSAVPAEVARAQARLGIAVTRGLLLDLLATGDREGTDAAMEAFIALYEAWLAAGAAAGPGA